MLRLVVGVTVMVTGALFAWRFPNAASGLTIDGGRMVEDFPVWLRYLPLVALLVIYFLLPFVVNGILVWRRRWRLVLLVNVAAFSAFILSDVVARILVSSPPSEFPDAYIRDGVSVDPNDPFLAASVAVLMIGLPYLSRGLRRLALGLVVFDLACTMSSAELPSITWLFDLGTGMTVGALVALAFGTPDCRPRPAAIIAALDRSGVELTSIDPAAVDARGSTPWFGVTAVGRKLFIKVLNSDNRAADLLFRLVRFVRLKQTGDERPFGSLRRAVEHEALLSLRASALQIRTPQLVAVSEIGNDGMLLAYEAVDGRSLDSVDPSDITDDQLVGIWELVAEMRRGGIAHRDLRSANIFMAADGTPWIIDFGFAELAASDLLLDTDVAELLASTAPLVGVTRAVDAADQVMGRDVLAAALPRIQPLALGSATQSAIKASNLLEPLREAVRTRTGIEKVEYEELSRVRARTIFTLAVAFAALWFLIPQLADARGALAEIVDANWWYATLAAIASLATYLGAGIAMQGSIRDPLPFGPTIYAQIASSFSNRITPANVGGMAVNVRYLQKQCVDTPIAVAAVGINTVAGALVHLAVLFTTLAIARREGDVDVRFPSVTILLIVVAALVVVLAIAMAIPWARRMLVGKAWPAVTKAWSGLKDVAHRPVRLIELFGGSFITTAAYIAALVASVRAMGGDTSVTSIALVYLTGSIVATAAPTPGGLGATEAAFIAGLDAAGESSDVAIPAVFLYRVATFWLPILPGWFALHRLERTGRL